MTNAEEVFVAFLKIAAGIVFAAVFAFGLHTCAQRNKADCREMLTVAHSLRDSLVIADVSSVECANLVRDSLVARAKRQP